MVTNRPENQVEPCYTITSIQNGINSWPLSIFGHEIMKDKIDYPVTDKSEWVGSNLIAPMCFTFLYFY